MTATERIRQILKKIIESGARAVYVSDRDGFEVCYLGDDALRNILQLMPSLRSWILYQVDMRYMVPLQSRYNTNIVCNDIPLIQLKFKIGQMKSVFLSYQGLSISCVYPSNTELDSRQLINALSEIMDLMSSNSISKADIIGLVKQHILEARKEISAGNKDGLLRNLESIKMYLLAISGAQSKKYIDHIDRLLEILKVAELRGEVGKKAKRSLLSLFRSIIKYLESEQ